MSVARGRTTAEEMRTMYGGLVTEPMIQREGQAGSQGLFREEMPKGDGGLPDLERRGEDAEWGEPSDGGIPGAASGHE